MTKYSIVILDPLPEASLARFRAQLPEGWTASAAKSRSPDDQRDAIASAPFAITGDAPVTAALFEHGAQAGLRAVHKWGVGYDSIDLEAARRCGVHVLRTTGSNAVPVAETTVGLMLALGRNLVAGHMGLQEGHWLKPQLAPRCGLLSGKTVGLIGFGAIGQSVARMLSGFGCTILYTKRTPVPSDVETVLNARFVDRETLIATSDIVSLHCALTPDTSRMIDGAALARMKPGALLVNTARGGLVDEAAVAEAVSSGHLGGAAFDVFAEEPVPQDNPLCHADRIVTTPHIGGTAAETYAVTVRRMIANLAAIADERAPDAGDVLVLCGAHRLR